MNRGRSQSWTRAGLLTHALVVLLGATMIATPQAMSWFCSWGNTSVATTIMPEVEEDVVEESARIADDDSESLFDQSGPGRSLHPSPADDAALPSRHAQVNVPPPKAC